MRDNMFTILLYCTAMAASAEPTGLPPDEPGAGERLNNSPRHGEWVTYEAAGGDKVEAWVVYPERPDAAPVVVVIHEIFGLTDWVRAVTDQFAAEGFIAIAPDLLSGKAPNGGGTSDVGNGDVRRLIANLDQAEVMRRIDAAADYATSLPSATERFGVVGYCWGGGVSFAYATHRRELSASVVFYGTSPGVDTLAQISAPVLGHYGGNDNRVNATIPAAREEMERLGKSYRAEIHDGAGHGFLRQQSGQDGANAAAAKKAWAATIGFFREHLEQ